MGKDDKISRRNYLKYAGAGIVAVAAAAGGYYAGGHGRISWPVGRGV